MGCIEELRSIEAHATESIIPKSPAVRTLGDGAQTVDSQSTIASTASSVFHDPFSMKERRSRLRRFLFLSILSAICAASAFDAAVNDQSQELSWPQKYMMFSLRSAAAEIAAMPMS